MREKTLLLGALTATAIAAGFGVYKARQKPPSLEIAPVSKLDSLRPLRRAEGIPIRLTATDGTGLRLAAMRASAAIEDPLALTELHLTFENPENRVLEGRFQITLPQGASVSRFAMKIGDVWQEGEVVEKQQAREAYEDFLHRKQDPALMEQGAGNEFTARVFPIPANGKKEIIIAYSETLEAGTAYVVPLKGLPALASLDIDVRAWGGRSGNSGGGSTNNGDSSNKKIFGLHQTSFLPAQDFIVDARSLPRSAGLRNGELMIARVVPFTTSRPDPIDNVVVLIDTSASRALGIAEQAGLVQRVFAKLPPDAKVSVACFDQEVVSIYDGTIAAFGPDAVQAITKRGALGASDFQQAIAWAGQEAKRKGARRVVIVSDGVATAGETDAQKIKVEVEKLRAAKVERIDAIAIGGIRDDAFFRTMVRGVLDKDGVVLDSEIGPEGVARRLGEATSSGVPVKVSGAKWSWPRTLDGLQAGDEVIVHAEVMANTPVQIDVGGQQFTPDLRTAERPLVERAWAQAKIQSLIEAPTNDPATTKRDIVLLSTRHRVLSAHTAMLVLETDADYARFGIDRKANRDVLTVREGRVTVIDDSKSMPTTTEEAQRKIGNEKSEKDKTGKVTGGKDGEKRNSNKTDDGDDDSWDLPFFGKGKKKAEALSDTPALQAPAPPAMTAAPTPPPVTILPPSPAASASGYAFVPAAPPASAAATATPPQEIPPVDLAKKAPPVTTPSPSPDPSSPAPPPPPAVVVNKPHPPGTTSPTTVAQPTSTPTSAPPPPRAITKQPPGRATPSPSPRPYAAPVRPEPKPRAEEEETKKALEALQRAQLESALGESSSSRAEPSDSSRKQEQHRNTRAPTVRDGEIVVKSGLTTNEAQRVLRSALPRLRACYNLGLREDASTSGDLTVVIQIAPSGAVTHVNNTGGGSLNQAAVRCSIAVLSGLKFPVPSTTTGGQPAELTATFDFATNSDAARSNGVASGEPRPEATPYDGRFQTVMELVRKHERDEAINEANRWRAEDPGDVMALVALGEAHEAKGDIRTAARAYGSILELFSSRADSRRFAGERLERLRDPAALRLAIDTYAKAVAQRPDHPASHRLHAFALLKHGDYEKAFEALRAGTTRSYPSGRFLGADRVLRDDLGLIAAAWTRAEPRRAHEIHDKLRSVGGQDETEPSLRFVLVWETDANDVDFHIYDGRGGHAFYSDKELPSGGELYADVTTGYGPECFTIRGPRDRRAYPYTLQAHYFSRGPMGYGMGKLQVIDHDGKGNLVFDERPFVVMRDRAYVDLGTVDKNQISKIGSGGSGVASLMK